VWQAVSAMGLDGLVERFELRPRKAANFAMVGSLTGLIGRIEELPALADGGQPTQFDGEWASANGWAIPWVGADRVAHTWR